MYFSALSAIDQLPGPDCDPDLLSVAILEPDARRLAGLGILERHLGDVERRLAALDPALRVRLGGLAVTGRDVDSGDDHLALLGHRLGHLAVLALVLAAEDDD